MNKECYEGCGSFFAPPKLTGVQGAGGKLDLVAANGEEQRLEGMGKGEMKDGSYLSAAQDPPT